VHEHDFAGRHADRLVPTLGRERAGRLDIRLRRAAALLEGRRLVNVTGDDQRKGGVYEIVRATLPYVRGAGIDVRWLDLTTTPGARPALEFFHVLAHGQPPAPDWQDQLAARASDFRHFTQTAAAELKAVLRPSDIVVLHDTQAALLAAELCGHCSFLAWHAHIGTTERNDLVDAYWEIIGPSVAAASARIFYRPELAPPELRDVSIFVPPAVDPSTAKSALLGRAAARARLNCPVPGMPLSWIRGASLNLGPDQVVGLQVSRWDPLKDMPGALRVLAAICADDPSFTGVVVGPSAQSASERREVGLCCDVYDQASPAARQALHIGVIDDCGTDIHDDSVRALQSAADLVLQKSVQEGFGLTVTEAMLRGKPVVAASVGGIPMQVHDGRDGVLVVAGADDGAWVAATRSLAGNAMLRCRLGSAARAEVLARHTVDRQLIGLVDGMSELLAQERPCEVWT
jgi:trehalose synthase